MADYSRAVIYTIRSKDSIYVGSTINFISRKYQHKECIYNENSPKYNRKLYKTIRENGEWSMRPYRAFPCETKLELSIEEERIRCELNADLNMISCGSGCATEKEYRIKYCEENKEKISEMGRQYRKKSKEKISEKMTCECGSIFRKYDLARHKKTKKHLNWEKLK